MKKNILTTVVPIIVFALLVALVWVNKSTPSMTGQESVTENILDEHESKKNLSCEMIVNPALEAECLNEVDEIIAKSIESEIRTTFNVSRCAELSEYSAQACKDFIEASGVKQAISYEDSVHLNKILYAPMQEQTSEGQEFAEEAYWDVEACNSVAGPVQSYCRQLIQTRIENDKLDAILEAGDSTGCDTLVIDEVKKACQQSFEIFVEPEDQDEQALDLAL